MVVENRVIGERFYPLVGWVNPLYIGIRFIRNHSRGSAKLVCRRLLYPVCNFLDFGFRTVPYGVLFGCPKETRGIAVNRDRGISYAD